MSSAVEIWKNPPSKKIYLLAGWRQWADAGSISSGLPQYLIQRTKAEKIGEIRSDGFYLFQFPGTHDLVRPVVKFDAGYPESLKVPRNELFFAGDSEQGVVFFIGDEPHLNIEGYVAAFLEAAILLRVQRVVSFGGVYGELPYEKERMVSAIYSLPWMKEEMDRLAVNLSDYHGGASIGSYICRRAADQKMEFAALYVFVPTYDFSNMAQIAKTIRLENDYMAWLGVMRRVNYMLKTNLDLSDLEEKRDKLIQTVDAKVEELDRGSPGLGVRAYLNRLSEGFTENPFDPLEDVWEEELRRLADKFESDET